MCKTKIRNKTILKKAQPIILYHEADRLFESAKVIEMFMVNYI